RLTGVGVGARTAVVARGAVGLGRIRARASAGIAGACEMALVGGAAHDGCSGTPAGRTAIAGGARVAVVAAGGVLRVLADVIDARLGGADVAVVALGRGIAATTAAQAHVLAAARCLAPVGGAGIAVVAAGRWSALAAAARAHVGRRARIVVVARCRVVGVAAAVHGVTGVVRARVVVVAADARAAACARLADVGSRARVAVVAGAVVGLVGIAAGAGRRVARAGGVALIRGGADDS